MLDQITTQRTVSICMLFKMHERLRREEERIGSAGSGGVGSAEQFRRLSIVSCTKSSQSLQVIAGRLRRSWQSQRQPYQGESNELGEECSHYFTRGEAGTGSSICRIWSAFTSRSVRTIPLGQRI